MRRRPAKICEGVDDNVVVVVDDDDDVTIMIICAFSRVHCVKPIMPPNNENDQVVKSITKTKNEVQQQQRSEKHKPR